MRWLSFYSALQEYSSILACQGIAKQKDYFEHEGNPLQTDPRTEIYFRVRGNHISNLGNISRNSIAKEKQFKNDLPRKVERLSQASLPSLQQTHGCKKAKNCDTSRLILLKQFHLPVKEETF